ncbi:DinB family protein [Actinocorallia sp. B10E7]|uniref:DinB family protein n=1 Tax=Actinocorallia sp. B10E7 TaxID=3153558 RepID=UPI00325C7F89
MDRAERSIVDVFDRGWARFLRRLDGLGDEEYFWEPVDGAWSVRQSPDGRWAIDGAGGFPSGDGTPPDPMPFTTIAWRIGHLGLTFIGFGDRLFFDGSVALDEVAVPPSAAASARYLEYTYQDYWREKLEEFEDERWALPVGPVFGPYAEHSGTDLVLHVLDEFIRQSAEIGVLRDLYRHRKQLGKGGEGSPA